MTKFHFIFEEIFRSNIYWFRGTRTDYEALVRRVFAKEAPTKAAFVQGTFEVYYIKGCPISVLWLRNRDVGMLAHECFHVAHHNLSRAGVILCDESEEVYAYYQQYLMRKIRG